MLIIGYSVSYVQKLQKLKKLSLPSFIRSYSQQPLGLNT